MEPRPMEWDEVFLMHCNCEAHSGLLKCCDEFRKCLSMFMHEKERRKGNRYGNL